MKIKKIDNAKIVTVIFSEAKNMSPMSPLIFKVDNKPLQIIKRMLLIINVAYLLMIAVLEWKVLWCIIVELSSQTARVQFKTALTHTHLKLWNIFFSDITPQN